MDIDKNIEVTYSPKQSRISKTCLGCVHKDVCQFKNNYFDVTDKIGHIIRSSEESTGQAIFSISQIHCKFYRQNLMQERENNLLNMMTESCQNAFSKKEGY